MKPISLLIYISSCSVIYALNCEKFNLPIINSIGFEHFKIKESLFKEGVEYYGRVQMPVHPKRDIAIFFSAIDNSLAKITKIHERDEKEWSAYLTSRERVLIREAREKRE